MKKTTRSILRSTLVVMLMSIIPGCNPPPIYSPTDNPSTTRIAETPPPSVPLEPLSTLQPMSTSTVPNTRTISPPLETAQGPKLDGTASAHIIVPGEPGIAEGVILDVKSNVWANLKQVESGDDYLINLYERPFTQKSMTYTGEIDIKRAEITSDTNFFYINIEVSNPDPLTSTLNASYAVELDVDLDGRGEFIVWTYFPTSSNWTTNSVSVFSDTNNDVGHSNPLKSDAPWKDGNGFNNEIFSAKFFSDPDLAWTRVSPTNPQLVQIAFKRSMAVLNAFLWSVWADKELHNSYQMDYNDYYTLEEAGSPYINHINYPLQMLHSLDNTCRAAYGFKPTYKEGGICPPEKTIKSAPTNKPAPVQEPTQSNAIKTITPGTIPSDTATSQPTKPLPPPAMLPGTITGCIYLDTNRNGIWDGSDTKWPYKGVNVIISATPVAVGSDSCFSLSINAGEYVVSLNHPGYDSSTPDSYSISVNSGETRSVFFGLVRPPP